MRVSYFELEISTLLDNPLEIQRFKVFSLDLKKLRFSAKGVAEAFLTVAIHFFE